MSEENKIKSPRGSEWRRWDLHVHSPLSGLNNQYPKKNDGSPEWNKFIQKLEMVQNVSVLGITDYFTIDGYKKILEFRKNNKLKNFDLILPNIEFRLNNVLSSKKNGKAPRRLTLHVIFSDEISPSQIEDQFLHELSFCYEGNPQDRDEIRKLKHSSLKDLGRKLKEEHKKFRDRSDFEIGCMNAVVNHEEITAKLEEKPSIFRNKYLIIFVEEHANLADWDSQDHNIRKVLLQKSDCIFSGNSKTRDWALGKLDLSPKDFIKEFKTLKPCILGSDAHSLEKICESVDNKFTWIKADPTFEGLKQIIYEPEIRVSLGEKPELYLYPQLISVQLKGTEHYQTKKDKEDFPPINLKKQLFLSSSLTGIIGPRASGKTVFVELLSYPFDKHIMEVRKGEKLPLIPFLEKRFPTSTVKVTYRQGEQEPKVIERRIADLSDPFYTSPLNIEYWHQGQIEEVADKKEKITEYMKDRLKSAQLLTLSQELDKLKTKLKNLRDKCLNKFETEIEKKKLLAEKKQIEGYFEKLKTQEYKNLIRRVRDNRTKKQLLSSFIESLENTIESLEESRKQIGFSDIPERNQILRLFEKNSSLQEEIKKFYKFTETDFSNIIKRFKLLKESVENSKEFKTLEKTELQLKNEFLEYCEKTGIKITKVEYEKRTNRLTIINQKLREVESKLREYKKAKQTHNTFVQELQEKLDKWKKENDRIIQEFNEMYTKSNIQVVWEDPKIKLLGWVKRQFVESDFITKSKISEYYHTPSPVREDFVEDIIKELTEDRNFTLKKIIKYLSIKKIPQLVKSRGKEGNLKWFFQRNETEITRENLIMRLQEYAERGVNLIQYKGKTLGKDPMSFGERCGTVIELILHSGDHPLIIDQPEEHLDAKFIANRVVDIIREQKANRQIIICTHNANIVVLGDSELVTVLSVNEEGTCGFQGSLENPGIRGQIYDVLEGGSTAFKKREQKYGLK